MSRVFSVSVFGGEPRYVQGAIRQRELAREFFPNWEFRVYTDDPTPYAEIKHDSTIISMSSGYGVFWRFHPLFEDDNNITIVRDSDSRITIRETLAVNEWVQSSNTFHTFKDHEAHYEFPIMAGTFGYKGNLGNDLYETMKIFEHGTAYYLSDQVFLRDHVWPLVKDSALVHANLNSGWFADTRTRLKNPTSFCGNGYNELDMPLYADTLMANTVITPSHKFDKGVLSW